MPNISQSETSSTLGCQIPRLRLTLPATKAQAISGNPLLLFDRSWQWKKNPLYLFVLLFSGSVFAHATIGILNFNEALFTTEAWKQQAEQLESVLGDDQSAADSLRQEVLDLQEKLQVNMPTLTSTEMQRIQEEAQFKQLKFQQIGERVQSTLRAARISS